MVKTQILGIVLEKEKEVCFCGEIGRCN